MAQPAYSNQKPGRSLRTQGIHGSGARSYKPEQAAHVLMILNNECVGRSHAMKADALGDRVGLLGRAVRDVVRDLELGRKILTDGTDGYYVCETVEDAERGTRRFESQVKNMQERIAARREMTRDLDIAQEQLL